MCACVFVCCVLVCFTQHPMLLVPPHHPPLCFYTTPPPQAVVLVSKYLAPRSVQAANTTEVTIDTGSFNFTKALWDNKMGDFTLHMLVGGWVGGRVGGTVGGRVGVFMGAPTAC